MVQFPYLVFMVSRNTFLPEALHMGKKNWLPESPTVQEPKCWNGGPFSQESPQKSPKRLLMFQWNRVNEIMNMESTWVLFGYIVLVEDLFSWFIQVQFFTATFLRAVAQLAVLQGQEKEIREVLPRTGCKVEFMRSAVTSWLTNIIRMNQNLWPQKQKHPCTKYGKAHRDISFKCGFVPKDIGRNTHFTMDLTGFWGEMISQCIRHLTPPPWIWKWWYWWRCSSATDVSSSTWITVYEYECIVYVYFTYLYIYINIDRYVSNWLYLEPICPLFYLQKEGSFPINIRKTGKDEVTRPSQIWPEEWIRLFWDSPVFTVC